MFGARLFQKIMHLFHRVDELDLRHASTPRIQTRTRGYRGRVDAVLLGEQF